MGLSPQGEPVLWNRSIPAYLKQEDLVQSWAGPTGSMKQHVKGEEKEVSSRKPQQEVTPVLPGYCVVPSDQRLGR